MARIRTVKPELFRHEDLFELEAKTGLPVRLAFIGMFSVADREGRFAWKPRQLKLDVLPYDHIEFENVLDALAAIGLIAKYEVDGQVYGEITGWKRHQVINQREAQSTIPARDSELHVHAHALAESDNAAYRWKSVNADLRETVFARDGHKCVRCFSSDNLTVDHIFPQSMGGTHAISNLRTLCRSCNSARPVAGDALIHDLAKDGLSLNDMQRICMHVHAQGEGKGREGNMEGEEERVVDDASPKRKKSELDFSSWPELPGKQVMADWQSTRKKKRAVISQTVIDEFGKELHRAHNAGFSVDQCLIACVVHNWQGFKLEWLQNKLGVSPHLPNLRAPPKTRDISLEQQLNDRSWANATPVHCEVVREG